MSMLRYDIRTGVKKIKTKTFLVISTLGIGAAGLAGSMAILGSANAADPSIYNNIPNPTAGNYPSQAFEAQSASEFGGQVQFAGTARSNPTITVLMSSWGCESGSWFNHDCLTTPGAKFSEPITLNIYNVGAGNSVGSLVATSTQTFNIPYRPSADNTNCTGAQAGEWYSATDNSCYNGFATPIAFNLPGTTLPNNAIISVAYNTTHYGYNPIGESTACYGTSAGCGYDSLNVALTYPPSTGSVPNPTDAYLNSTWTGAYCDSGVSGTGTFRLDSGCWTGFQPAIQVTASEPKVQGLVTGGLTLSGPRQQISFNAFVTGANSTSDYGTVEYQNFEYPGGLHYTANVTCATVSGSTARFMFQIRNGYPGLSRLYVVSTVTDGGSPGKGHDTYGHAATSNLATAQDWCENGAPAGTYPITGGNAVVHKQ
jgi:hypothetical protein